jgi:two-component system, OmpR family, sensor histidine kinase QseC
MKRPSLIARLIFWQIIAMGLTWLGLLSWLVVQMLRYENGDLDQRMSYFATILAETAAGADPSPESLRQRVSAVETVFTEGIIERLGNASGYRANYQLLDARGALLLRTGQTPTEVWVAANGFTNVVMNGTTFRAVRVASSDGTVFAIVAESADMRQDSLWPMLRMISTSQLLIFGICILVLWWAARRGLRPIAEFANYIAKRKTGNKEPLHQNLAYREIEPLISAFDDLLTRESKQLELEREFLAEAAHELRTPLAVLVASAHRLIEASSTDTRAAAATQLQRGLDRASHLVSQLLTTARIENSAAYSALNALDFAELLRERMAYFALYARKKAIDLSLEAPERLTFLGNTAGLTSIIDNLVDNAIRYTPNQGSVQVKLALKGNAIQLVILDSGPGIAAAQRARVFDRFYRAPDAQAQGSGLGLSIVLRLVKLYHGQIELDEGVANNGLGVRLSLPLVRAEDPA